jgi:hypothetical protein
VGIGVTVLDEGHLREDAAVADRETFLVLEDDAISLFVTGAN